MTVDHGKNDFQNQFFKDLMVVWQLIIVEKDFQNQVFKDEWNRGAFDATALQPALLDPVDQVLLVWVVPEINLFIHYLLLLFII